MKVFKTILPRAVIFFLIFTVICGGIYTLFVTGIAQLIFPKQANGSIIEVDGKKYGSALLGQQYTDDSHLWGRIMNIDVSTFKDKDGKTLMYATPENISPASEEYSVMVAARVEKIKKANPEMGGKAIPVDLVTCSGSGLDPHISTSAAEYQIARLVKTTSKPQAEIEKIIKDCTSSKLLGVFGEETVNVLKVNLMLDGILK